MPVRSALFTLVLLTATSLAEGPEPLQVEVRQVSEKVAKGDLVTITAKEVVVNTAEGESKVPIDQVLEVNFTGRTAALPPDVKEYHNVELTDGSLLHCSIFSFAKGNLNLVLLSGDEVSIEMTKVKYILRGAQDAALVKDWREQAIIRKTSFDVLGSIDAGRLNVLEGTFGAVDEKGEKINFTREGGSAPLALPIKNLKGILFSRGAPAGAAPIVCKFQDTFGDLLIVSEVARTDPNYFTLTTSVGVKIRVTAKFMMNFDYNKGKLTYLSDLPPASKPVYKSRDGSQEEFRANKNLDNQPLVIDSRAFNKGLAIHSHTELEYDLGGNYLEFKATVGFDDNVGGHPGPVSVRLEGDGKELMAMTLDRSKSRKPQDVVVNVKDVSRLKIIVGSPDRHDLGRSVDLGDARVSK